MTGPGKALRYAGLATALTLTLAACTPATFSAIFAPCPKPTTEEWAASHEEWPTPDRIDTPSVAFETVGAR